ncbi:MAG: 50S ribosomal protein L11 methyltransferase, partial [Actinomycetota bacterium]
MIERLISVTVSTDLVERVSDRMWSWGVRGVEEAVLDDGSVRLSTSVGNQGDAIARALGTLDPSWQWSVDDVDATAADDWKRHPEPIRIRDDLIVAPAWHQDADSTIGDELVLRIDPGAAFGLGDHPTTRSALRAVADELDHRSAAGRPVETLLDVGCGAGALAILAARRGVRRVRAIDIADAAVAATVDNAGRNGVGDRIQVDTADLADLVT